MRWGWMSALIRYAGAMASVKLRAEKISGALGAELRGIDLREELDEAGFKALEQAILEHHVVFLRDQPLSDEQHLALAQRFGPLSLYPLIQALGGEIALETIEDSADSPPKAAHWHTDVTWIPEPPKLGILCAQEIPPYGGDTIWANLHVAYDALSPLMQQRIDGLCVYHDTGEGYWTDVERELGAEKTREIRAKMAAGAEHPLVRTHPVTGRKALFVAGYFMQRVVGMNEAESRMLLDFLMRHACEPRFQCRWRWQVHDLAIWDERCTMHHALSDHFPQRRRMRRCTVDGERPYFDA